VAELSQELRAELAELVRAAVAEVIVPPLLLTPAEAAARLRVSRATLYALVEAGQIAVVYPTGDMRISARSLERYVERLEGGTGRRRKSAARGSGQAHTRNGAR
jgi:excisionase family DNA binding protein